MNWKVIVANAVAGFVAALVVDINAWSKTTGQFDWWLASKRWVAGAISGAFGGSAVTSIQG